MAGTLNDQATLATDNAFIAKVKCALIFRATEIWGSSSAQTLKALQQARNILDSGGSDAARIAALIASGNPTIAAAAPAVPNDSDTQYAVNTTLTSLQ